MPDEKAILTALKKFAAAVTAKMNTLTAGEAEDQLRGPFDVFMQEVGHALALKIVCTGETKLKRIGKPDYAVHAAKLLAGCVELKAPGTGANPNRFTGHNRDQWKRFQAIPNLIYTDGNEWGLYRSGERERSLVRLSGDVATDGKKAVTAQDEYETRPCWYQVGQSRKGDQEMKLMNQHRRLIWSGIVAVAVAVCAFGPSLAAPNRAPRSAPNPAISQWTNAHLLDPETARALPQHESLFQQRYEKPFVDRWIREVRGNDRDKAAQAAALLGMVKSPRAVDALTAVALARRGNNRLKWVAVRSLGQIGSRRSVPVLIELLDHNNRQVCVYSRASLAEITGVYFGGDKDRWRRWLKENPPTSGGGNKAVSSIESTRRLKKAIDNRYSYRDLRGVDWDALFAKYGPQLEASQTPEQFATIATRLLAHAKDMHIWLKGGGRSFRPFRRKVIANCNLDTLRKTVPQWRDWNSCVSTGRFADGIGYILIRTWAKDKNAQLRAASKALKQLGDTSALIVDVRLNGGGSETIAHGFAGCFVSKPVLYAKHVYRDTRRASGFTDPRERMLEPNANYPTYRGKVVVLTGPVNMSSCEGFLLMMKQVPGCKLIGDTSYGSSGNPKPNDLGNGVTVWLPSWIAMRPDGTAIETVGIKPDVVVKATQPQLRAVDPVLAAGLALLRKK